MRIGGPQLCIGGAPSVKYSNNAAMMVNVKRTGILCAIKTASTCRTSSEHIILLDV